MAAQIEPLSPEERLVLAELGQKEEIEGQRARAVLAVAEGQSVATAAADADLTANQVRYIVRKFEEKRLLAFPGALALLPAEDTAPSAQAAATKPSSARSQLDGLLAQMDTLIRELRATLPEAGEYDYSPVRMLTLVRDSAARYAPDVQLRMLEPFQDMTAEDLRDLETWKGIAYMITYSTQFQANKAREQLNESLPEPMKPDTMTRLARGNFERFAPQLIKDMAANLEEASAEDLLDPDTWKGLAYMVGYSAQFQAGQTKEKLNEQLPDPLKPDTIIGMVRSAYDRFTPEVARQIVSMFEDATLADLFDPETWKGVWYLLNYSLQFQADQMKERLVAAANEGEESS